MPEDVRVPEGDVVWRTADRLHRALAGRVLTACDLRWPSVATVDLSGRTVLEVRARGKHLLLRVDGEPPVTVHSHLRMEGSWHVHRTGERWGSARTAAGVRAILANAQWTAVGHKLGMLDVVPTAEEGHLVGHLGPDVLGPDWDPQAVLDTLAAQPDREIGDALLDQRVLAGVGTMFMAEALFVRGISPWTPVREVADPQALLATVHRLLDANRERVSQATTGDTRPGRDKWVHARSGRPCWRCGTTVRVAPIGPAPHDRTAFYCPHCQPGPAPTDDRRPQRPLGSSRRARS
jgi:endonuclease VIII